MVAVDLAEHRDDQLLEDADLCLLLWHDGWEFGQLVGKVSSAMDYDGQWDWTIKYRKSKAYYVLNRLALYPQGDHLSWCCDAKTHRLGKVKRSTPVTLTAARKFAVKFVDCSTAT